ncbi:hypothetical protein SAMD00019534_004560 [Acytostelium subglobosum LB1]|uniref:hypothetical protein n=1 Tax=Acytostelium subglobosum LB1 TaxID=1410327 RepID=UPI0006447D45|nr:hypothetical protein SAMD00019534_004560 [Acytostelium subglobosum LB1]GAM17281.1 hypothetical protein SAMD00019534_004560 [Acytostelium subglobosum LB1]|eukprot:XP_012759343.1 hypothetical protein SAMD00019534_004560 [Acytostelium subglobosum LB1]
MILDNLPSLLYKQIMALVDADDIVCLSLTCKRIFGDNYDGVITTNTLPSSLLELRFGALYNQGEGVVIKRGQEEEHDKRKYKAWFGSIIDKILTPKDEPPPKTTPLVLPPSLTKLTFGKSFDQHLDPGVLPISLTELTFGTSFNQSLDDGTLPRMLNTLIFGANYNQPFFNDDILPPTLTKLHFGSNFDQHIPILPVSLLELVFGFRFNHPIMKKPLPGSITRLVFGYYFDQPMNNYTLPTSLTELSFAYDETAPVNRSTLSPELMDTLLPGELPNPLAVTAFAGKFQHIIQKDVLPKNLKVLHLGREFDQEMKVKTSIFPPTLVEIKFGREFNQCLDIGIFPRTLKRLTFGYMYNKIIVPGVLPEALEHLELGHSFNETLRIGVLPTNLQYLTFGRNFNQLINQQVIPRGLLKLTFGHMFNQELKPECLPPTLLELKFGANYTTNLHPNSLPSSLKTLMVASKHALDALPYPPNLKTVIFGDYSKHTWHEYYDLPGTVNELIIHKLELTNPNEVVILPQSISRLTLVYDIVRHGMAALVESILMNNPSVNYLRMRLATKLYHVRLLDRNHHSVLLWENSMLSEPAKFTSLSTVLSRLCHTNPYKQTGIY